MKLRKVFHKAPASSARIPRLLTLCAFFAAGIVAGQVAQHAVTGGELADYLRSYAGMVAENGAAQASLLRVAVAYLRVAGLHPVLCCGVLCRKSGAGGGTSVAGGLWTAERGGAALYAAGGAVGFR